MGRAIPSDNNPTLGDVARLAGVSIATASRALSNPDLVAENTREAVRKAVSDCGYKVNLVARSLRKRCSDTILVLIPDINNEFYPAIISSMESHARAAGFSIILGMTSNLIEREHSYFELLAAQRADGLLILDGGIDKLLEAGVRPSVPAVQVLECTGGTAMPSVRIDEHKLAGQAVFHLASLGHRRIAHIAGSADSLVSAERIAGFRAAMAECGIACPDELIVPGNYTHEGAETAMTRLLNLDQLPTAVFCANDTSAIGALRACRRNGLVVPRDMSIIGVDDIEQASLADPQLTTIRQPRQEIGARAMALMIDLIRKDAGLKTQIVLPTELVVRQSTAAPPVLG